MPQPLYVDGASGLTKGVGFAETGLKIESYEVTADDPKEYSFDQYGGHDGFAHAFNPSYTISVSGEISLTTSGIPISQFGTAVTFGNESNYVWTDIMGASTTDDEAIAGVSTAGGNYLESITFTQSRDGFMTLSASFVSHPDIA